MTPFCTLSLNDLKTWLTEKGHKPFHAKQIFEWVYQKSVIDFDEMSNLSLSLRQALKGAFSLVTLEKVATQDSKDGETYKFLFKMKDGSHIESVLICSGTRRTVCVSSQVGCPAKCAFCASGKQGFFRNLSQNEIVEQILIINHWLNDKGERVCHIVYMGMGEPMRNYDAVVGSIRDLSDPEKFNMSERRITVSTVGVVEGIRALAQEGLKCNLVLSLHAPNQHIRKKIIPYARKYPLEEIMTAMDYYAESTKRDITYEYTLIAGINDHPDHAYELAQLLKGRQCTVNLIPYNPVPGVHLKRPSKEAIKAFRAVLFGCKINNTCRYTKGDDIAAACGQLKMHEENKLKVVE